MPREMTAPDSEAKERLTFLEFQEGPGDRSMGVGTVAGDEAGVVCRDQSTDGLKVYMIFNFIRKLM